MKLQSKNTAIVDISLKGLSDPERHKFEDMLINNDVKFNYDIQRQQYVALLQVQKDDKPMKKSKSMTIIKPHSKQRVVTARTQKHFHQDCGDMFLEPRAYIPVKVKTTPIKSTEDPEQLKSTNPFAKSRSPSPNLPKARSVINIREGATVVKTRLDVLANYQPCFPLVDLSKILFTPVLISRSVLMRKIEFFYNKQFDALNRIKTPTALQLSKVIYDFLVSKYKDTPNYYLQSLVNLLYSIDRNHEIPEIDLFQQFLGSKPGNLTMLFYLYIRQVFKIVTSTFFLNHKVDEADPTKIRIPKEQAFTIVEQALYGNDHYHELAVQALEVRLARKSSIGYYNFMVFMTNLKIDYWVC